MKETIFALKETERKRYLSDILSKRRLVIEAIKDLYEEDPEEWLAKYSYLCEYVSIVFHFEMILEELPRTATWDEEKKYWLMEELLASKMILYVNSAEICKNELLNHGLSFSLH